MNYLIVNPYVFLKKTHLVDPQVMLTCLFRVIIVHGVHVFMSFYKYC